MLLFVDADKNHDTGWCGYDFLVNKNVVDEQRTTVARHDPSSPENPWAEVGQAAYRYAGKSVEIALPRDLVGPEGDELSFDFHWCDNPTELKDAISLCTTGDSAPNRRFNYRCIWRE
jgi:hypothetical protein